MTIKEQLTSDLKLVMKMKDKIAIEVIRLIKARIISAEKIDGNELDNEEVGKILVKASKDHQKSIDAFKKANRIALLEKEVAQLNYLRNYLPKEMDEEQIVSEVEKIISDNGYTSIRDMGKVMQEFNKYFQANGGIVSSIVKKKLLPTS